MEHRRFWQYYNTLEKAALLDPAFERTEHTVWLDLEDRLGKSGQWLHSCRKTKFRQLPWLRRKRNACFALPSLCLTVSFSVCVSVWAENGRKYIYSVREESLLDTSSFARRWFNGKETSVTNWVSFWLVFHVNGLVWGYMWALSLSFSFKEENGWVLRRLFNPFLISCREVFLSGQTGLRNCSHW